VTENPRSTSNEDKEQSEYSAKVMNAGVEAKALLSHPMFARFFSVQAADAVNAFANLPDDAGLESYKAVHLRFKAINALKAELELYVLKAHDVELQLKREDEDIVNAKI